MIWLLALSVAVNAGLTFGFLRYLTVRDREERKDRTTLLNRIQAPRTAVYESIEPSEGPDYISQFTEHLEGVNDGG